MPLCAQSRQITLLKELFILLLMVDCSSADIMNVYVWLFSPRELSFGRGSTAPVGGGSFPAIIAREPWDGRDGEVSAG